MLSDVADLKDYRDMADFLEEVSLCEDCSVCGREVFLPNTDTWTTQDGELICDKHI